MEIGNYNFKDMMKLVRDTLDGSYPVVVPRPSPVSANIFISSRPTTITPKMNDFVVIAFPTRIYNNGGAGNTTCRISLYAKDVQNQENAVRLDAMQRTLYSRLPISTPKYCFQSPTFYDGGSDGLGFHAWHFTLDVLIK